MRLALERIRDLFSNYFTANSSSLKTGKRFGFYSYLEVPQIDGFRRWI
jgi:hypothetical protein